MNGNKTTTPGTIQVESDHYSNHSYDSKGRFCSYWHQINEVLSLNHDRVLEVGVGNGFVSKYLKGINVNITSLDIDKKLKPDIVGSVLCLPFKDNSFDIIACYEVLEHLPYKFFHTALSEIYRVSNSYTVISLPDVERVFRFLIRLPKMKEVKNLFELPKLKKPPHEFDGRHYWEIGKNGYPLNKITDDIQETGFKIESTYRVFENPYHRFFVLRKMN